MQTGANKILRMLVLGLDGFLFQDIRFNIADGNIGIVRIKINCADQAILSIQLQQDRLSATGRLTAAGFINEFLCKKLANNA